MIGAFGHVLTRDTSGKKREPEGAHAESAAIRRRENPTDQSADSESRSVDTVDKRQAVIYLDDLIKRGLFGKKKKGGRKQHPLKREDTGENISEESSVDSASEDNRRKTRMSELDLDDLENDLKSLRKKTRSEQGSIPGIQRKEFSVGQTSADQSKRQKREAENVRSESESEDEWFDALEELEKRNNNLENTLKKEDIRNAQEANEAELEERGGDQVFLTADSDAQWYRNEAPEKREGQQDKEQDLEARKRAFFSKKKNKGRKQHPLKRFFGAQESTASFDTDSDSSEDRRDIEDDLEEQIRDLVDDAISDADNEVRNSQRNSFVNKRGKFQWFDVEE